MAARQPRRWRRSGALTERSPCDAVYRNGAFTNPQAWQLPAGAVEPRKPGPRGLSCRNLSKKEAREIIQSLWVLVVDDNQYMRKMIRNLLVNCGVKDIYEAADGIAALDAIRTVGPTW